MSNTGLVIIGLLAVGVGAFLFMNKGGAPTTAEKAKKDIVTTRLNQLAQGADIVADNLERFGVLTPKTTARN